MSNYSDQIRNSGLMETYLDNWIYEQTQIDENYRKRLAEYNQHVENLRLQKEAFIKENPDFPNPDILFLNVMALPQRMNIILIH